MLYLTLTKAEVYGLLEAWLFEWDARFARLKNRMLDAGRRHGRETVVGVYEDEVICQLTQQRPEDPPHGLKMIELQLLEEHLALKQRRYDQLTRDFWVDCYWGEER